MAEPNTSPSDQLKTITVRYFAALREQAGKDMETIQTTAKNSSELLREVSAKHSFTLNEKLLKVSINLAFADMEKPLQHGDEVVFIPPVAGG